MSDIPIHGICDCQFEGLHQAMAHQASLAIIDAAEPGDVLDWECFTSRIDGRPIAQFIDLVDRKARKLPASLQSRFESFK